MTFDQAAIVGLLVVMFLIYALDRFRVELVALCGLTLAFLLGLIPVQRVFAGFSSPAVVTVVEVLLIVTVLARTRVVERLAQTLIGRFNGERAALAVLCAIGAFVSVFMNNIGALALMFPVALSVCARLGIPPARMLMALSFSTLLGGICSLTGTPANLVVNDWMIAQTGGGFGYFEIGLVGAPVAVAGILWLVLASPRVFRGLDSTPLDQSDLGPAEFLSEVVIPRGSAFDGEHLTKAESKGAIQIHGVVRADRHLFARRSEIVLQAGDILLVEGEADRLDGLRASGVVRATSRLAASPGLERVDVVVMPDSTILGSRIGALESLATHGVAVAGLASRRRRIEGRFEDLQLGLGDVLMLVGERAAIRQAAAEAGVLRLSIRASAGAHPAALRSLLFFAIGIAATAFGLAPPEIAFGAVVITMAVTGTLKLRSAFQDLNWPIIILLACMIPLGAAVEDTGAAQVIANHIVSYLPPREPMLVVAVMLALAIAITPFIDNVSTAAVLSPIAAGVATRAGVPVEPLLVAVAVGASLDFLTPFGHHNNAVVMGAAGYRFIDFPKLGVPLLAICAATALLFLWHVWL